MNECSFDLIFMDCNMPIMDGYEASQKIREFLFLNNLKQPIICAVSGHCIGGGFETALGCDILLASANAEFILPEVSHGVTVGNGGHTRLN